MKTVGITGGTGFVGTRIAQLLVAQGCEVIIFSRGKGEAPQPGINYAHWDPQKKECDTAALARVEGLINLAGAGIADKRWTTARKKEITGSRVAGTHFLVQQLQQYGERCIKYVAASAIGYYGPDKEGNPPFTEESPAHNGFLGQVCSQWEAASQQAAAICPVALIRIGVVLGREAGAFPRLTGPLKFGVMPIPGNGRQVVSWIWIDDLARLFVFVLQQDNVRGVYNGVAPHSVTYETLMRAVAKVKGGVAIPVRVPPVMLKLALGEMSTVILDSCTVSADKTLSAGFAFDKPCIEPALETIMT